MVNHSPFAIATAVALPSATPDFAKDLYVANAARSPEGDMVTIASSSDQNFKNILARREPVDGYSIASIEWSDRVGATKVTISKDGKFATITFNEALLSQPAPNAPPVPNAPTAAVPAVPAVPSPLAPSVPRQAAPTSRAWDDSAKSKRQCHAHAKSPAAAGRTIDCDQPPIGLQSSPQSSSVVSGFRSGPAENRS